ncbi:MAG: GspH/FimT family pseudopilin [Burkholderiales bacterium]
MNRTNSVNRTGGFTLIEIMVVVLILAVAVGLIGVNLGRGETDRVREEADRLVLLLQAARERAILDGQVLAVQFFSDGYRFLQLDARGRLTPIAGDDVLSQRRLPEGVQLTAAAESALPGSDAGLLFEPSGVLPEFTLSLRSGAAVWQAQGTADGKIRSLPPGSAHAG